MYVCMRAVAMGEVVKARAEIHSLQICCGPCKAGM